MALYNIDLNKKRSYKFEIILSAVLLAACVGVALYGYKTYDLALECRKQIKEIERINNMLLASPDLPLRFQIVELERENNQLRERIGELERFISEDMPDKK